MCVQAAVAHPAHASFAGGPSQATVELEDDSGRMWQMTYRCVPHRYSYELRAGWKVQHLSCSHNAVVSCAADAVYFPF